MKNDKVFIAVLAVIAIILGVLVFVYFDMSRKSGFTLGLGGGNSSLTVNNTTFNTVGGGTGNSISNSTILPVDPHEQIVLGEVTDYTEFFNVNHILNMFYSLVANRNSQSIMNVFDAEYMKKNNITTDNLTDYVNSKYDEITFYSKKMYRKGANGVRYYFVNGELQNYDFSAEILTEVENIDILVIVDYNNDCFSIVPISNDGDLFNFAQNYKFNEGKRLKKNEDNDYNEQKFNDEIISISYIRYFQNMLYLNTKKAYEMLGSDTKSKYPKLENFTDDLDRVYGSITTKIHSYNVKGENGKRIYSVMMTEDNEIIFEESSIMNFKVDFKFKS